MLNGVWKGMARSAVSASERLALGLGFEPPPLLREFVGVRECPVLQTRQFDNLPPLGFGDAVTMPGIVVKLGDFAADRLGQSTASCDVAGLPQVGVRNPE